MEVEQILSLVEHAENDTVIDAAELPVSQVHAKFMGTDRILAHREIYARSVDFAWGHLREIIERGQSDIGSLYGRDVHGQPWAWEIDHSLSSSKLEKFFSHLGALAEKTTAHARSGEGFLTVANSTISKILSECGKHNIGENREIPCIAKINATLEALFMAMVENAESNACVLGAVCTLAIGEYGIIFALAMLLQAAWGRMRLYPLPTRGKLAQHQRVKESFNGHFRVDDLQPLAQQLLKTAPSPRSALTAGCLMLWLSMAEKMMGESIVDGRATLGKFSTTGAALWEYIGSPAKMEELQQMFATPNILSLNLQVEKFNDLFTSLDLGNLDLIEILQAASQSS